MYERDLRHQDVEDSDHDLSKILVRSSLSDFEIMAVRMFPALPDCCSRDDWVLA